MQIFGRKLIHFSIFNLIFAICNTVSPILQTAKYLKHNYFTLRYGIMISNSDADKIIILYCHDIIEPFIKGSLPRHLQMSIY